MGPRGYSPIGSSRQVEGPQIRSQPASPGSGGQFQGQLRSLPGERIQQRQGEQSQQSWLGEASAPAPAPPAMFRTAAVPQQEAQESNMGMGAEDDEENEQLRARVEELEQRGQHLEQQLSFAQQQQVGSISAADVAAFEQRIREAEESEASALQAHEIRVSQINELEQEIFRMRAEQGMQSGSTPEDGQHMVELNKQLDMAKNAEAAYKRQVAQQAQTLEEHAREIQRSRNQEAQLQQEFQQHQSHALELERRHAEAQREKETHQRNAEQQLQARQQLQAQHSNVAQELDVKSNELRSLEDAYQNQLVDERRRNAELQDLQESETRAKEFHMQQNQSNQDTIQNLQNEVTYLKNVETFHKKNGDLHRREAQRLKRLRDEDTPPKPPLRMPLKALEERIMHLACFLMMGICALPIMGAIAVLADDNYQFWLGSMWPYLVIGGCVFVFLLFVVTMHILLNYAVTEHRSQFTMAFTWATFAALLGIILVPLSLMANKEALNIASTISQGCLTAMPQSELLVDYSQVLYNIRLSPNCTGATSVTECNGWSENKYTNYLQYLESDFHCGPLCPESPPPARVVVAPSLANTPSPTLKPTIQPPPMFGPPLQPDNALQTPVYAGSSFLQAEGSQEGQLQREIRLHSVPGAGGVMETALPHMQAKKLFSIGSTRMSCYPLIATRLQVLVTTFGGLWYWEGMGLIIISLLTSIYAGLYFALSGQSC